MDVFYQFLELFATFVEGALVISVASSMSERRYSGKKHVLLVILFLIVYTALITFCNTLEVFSFVTISIGVVFSFLIVSVLSSGKCLLRITSTILTWFFLIAVEYLLTYSLIMLIGNSVDISKGFSLFITPGTYRLTLIVTDKILQLSIFILCRKLYSKIRLLSNRNLVVLSIITLLSFIVINILTGLIYTDSLLIIQIAVIFATFFIVLTLIATIFAIAISSKHQNEKRTVELMKLSGQMMEKNYSEIHKSHEIIRQQVHDFKNHLRAIDGMAEADSKVKEYTQKLLASSYSSARLCNCGNDIIDSIINCKEAEANEKCIQFEYSIDLSDTLNIEPIDICAILANQIDNAIEACEKIDNADNRRISINIFRKESFAFFTVKNTVSEDPFNKKHELITTKNNDKGLHGFGLRIIRETAEKYNGTANNRYEDGCFISAVMPANA